MGKLPHKLLHILMGSSMLFGASVVDVEAAGERRPPALNPGGDGRVFYDNPSQQLGSLGAEAAGTYMPASSYEPMSPPPANFAEPPLMPVPDSAYSTYPTAPVNDAPVAYGTMPPPPQAEPTPYYSDMGVGPASIETAAPASAYEPMPSSLNQPGQTASYEPELVPLSPDAYSSQQPYASAGQYPSVEPMYHNPAPAPYEPAPMQEPAYAPAAGYSDPYAPAPADMGYNDPNSYYESQEVTYVSPPPLAGAPMQDGGYDYAMMDPAYQPEPSQANVHYAPQQSVNPYRTLPSSRYEQRRIMERQFRFPKRYY